LTHAPRRTDAEVIVIGGGPAGSAAGRLLAAWGHRVVVLTRPAPRARRIAESLPPSVGKLLSEVGALEAVDRAGFYRSTGNTVWWETEEPRLEAFGGATAAAGYQVFRPDFDRLLLDVAARAGADVRRDADVRRIQWNGESVDVEYQPREGAPVTIGARFVIDCSGRSGVLSSRGRRYEPGYQSQALLGVWHRAEGWGLPDDTHTLVETYENGWAWSVPISVTTRHVGIMVDGTTTSAIRGATLEHRYRSRLEKTTQLRALCSRAVLDRVWACDASVSTSDVLTGPWFLLAGDAASFIDPLSSFGVKKALASAWVGAVAVHTCLSHPERSDVALDFFSSWERRAYQSAVRGTRAHARDALARHPHAFWERRAAGPDSHAGCEQVPVDDDQLLRIPAVQAAWQFLKQSETVGLVPAADIRLTTQGVIRHREIVLEQVIEVQDAPGGVRFLAGVDLLHLTRLAHQYHEVCELYDAYCRTQAPVPLPNVLGALSVLIANGVLLSPGPGRPSDGATLSPWQSRP
jgi:flavin-dependent dehydrogenase